MSRKNRQAALFHFAAKEAIWSNGVFIYVWWMSLDSKDVITRSGKARCKATLRWWLAIVSTNHVSGNVFRKGQLSRNHFFLSCFSANVPQTFLLSFSVDFLYFYKRRQLTVQPKYPLYLLQFAMVRSGDKPASWQRFITFWHCRWRAIKRKCKYCCRGFL